jgi:hypothetical protein
MRQQLASPHETAQRMYVAKQTRCEREKPFCSQPLRSDHLLVKQGKCIAALSLSLIRKPTTTSRVRGHA